MPILVEYYEKYTRKPVNLLLNKNAFKPTQLAQISTSAKETIKINYFGGLLSSSRGQHIINLVLALRTMKAQNSRSIQLRMIGRFKWYEKIFYNYLYDEIFWFEEVPGDQFSKFCSGTSFNLLVCTTKRDVLPTKLYTYLNYKVPILLLGNSKSVEKVIPQNLSHFTRLGSSRKDILYALKNLQQPSEPFPKEIILSDDREAIVGFINT